MRVLWLYYNVPEILVSELKIDNWLRGTGWIEGLLDMIMKEKRLDMGIVCQGRKFAEGKKENMTYWTYPSEASEVTIKSYLEKILVFYDPDIVHIWGSEAKCNGIMIEAVQKLNMVERLVMNIQGLCSVCSYHYFANLPLQVICGFTLRDILRGDNILLQRKKFYQRGQKEIGYIKSIKNVIGRTDWDEACVKAINTDINYYFCNEILRPSFYTKKWDYTKCDKYSIFMSQATYPIKGLHFVLLALPEVLKEFPDAKLYIAGADYIHLRDGMKGRIRQSSYAKYIRKIILKNHLEDCVQFIGLLNEVQMSEQFLRANVFVSASTVENESNSLSEAKSIGMPVIASFVGGVTSRIEHNYDGFAYQHDAVYMLAYYLCEIFRNPQKAIYMGEKARMKALEINSKEKNTKKLMEIYDDIQNKKENK